MMTPKAPQSNANTGAANQLVANAMSQNKETPTLNSI